MGRGLVATGCFFVSVLSVTSARADDDKQACWAIIESSVDQACACFAKVAEKSRTPDVLVDWGKCERKRNRPVDALHLYEEARPHYEKTPEVSTRLDEEIQRIRAELGRASITLRATIKLDRPALTIDGKPSAWGETWLVPGTHEARLADGTGVIDTMPFVVTAGGMIAIELPRTAPPPHVVPPPPLAETSQGTHPLTIAGGVVLAVGGVGLIGAAITGGMMISAYDTAKDGGCPRCDGEARDAAERGASLEGINTASWIVGIVGVAAGVPMIIVGETAFGDEATNVTVRVGPGGAWLTGSF